MKAMKLRLLIMGCITSVLGAGFLVLRGYSAGLLGLLGVGIALLLLGLIWK
ncbi:MAG: hypothetical protein JRN52_15495 [Nitrososphaerota archaeon]|nr:hypothetical protein [Nitrososphaerota archaeon]